MILIQGNVNSRNEEWKRPIRYNKSVQCWGKNTDLGARKPNLLLCNSDAKTSHLVSQTSFYIICNIKVSYYSSFSIVFNCNFSTHIIAVPWYVASQKFIISENLPLTFPYFFKIFFNVGCFKVFILFVIIFFLFSGLIFLVERDMES